MGSGLGTGEQRNRGAGAGNVSRRPGLARARGVVLSIHRARLCDAKSIFVGTEARVAYCESTSSAEDMANRLGELDFVMTDIDTVGVEFVRWLEARRDSFFAVLRSPAEDNVSLEEFRQLPVAGVVPATGGVADARLVLEQAVQLASGIRPRPALPLIPLALTFLRHVAEVLAPKSDRDRSVLYRLLLGESNKELAASLSMAHGNHTKKIVAATLRRVDAGGRNGLLLAYLRKLGDHRLREELVRTLETAAEMEAGP